MHLEINRKGISCLSTLTFVFAGLLQTQSAFAATGPQKFHFYNLSNIGLRIVFNSKPGVEGGTLTDGQYVVKDPSHSFGLRFEFPDLTKNFTVLVQKNTGTTPVLTGVFHAWGPFSVGGVPVPTAWPEVDVIAYHPVYINKYDGNFHRADKVVHITTIFPTPKDSAYEKSGYTAWWGSGWQSMSAYDKSVPTHEATFAPGIATFTTDIKPSVETINGKSVTVAPVVIYNLRYVPIQITRGSIAVTLCKWSWSIQKWTCSRDNTLNSGEVGIVWNSDSPAGGPTDFWRAPLPNKNDANVAKAAEVMFPPIGTAFDTEMSKYNGKSGNDYYGYEPRDPLKGGNLILLDVDPQSLISTPSRGRYHFYQFFIQRADMPEKCQDMEFQERLTKLCYSADTFKLNW